MLKCLFLLITIMFPFFSLTVHAQPANPQHIVIVSKLLSKNIQVNYQTLSSTKQFDLISTNEIGIMQLLITKQQISNSGFIDVTKVWQNKYRKNIVSKNQAAEFLTNYMNPNKPLLVAKNEPYKIQYQIQVNQLLKQMNPQLIWNSLATLSSFTDRSYDTIYGTEAAYWIKSQIEMIIKESGREDISTFIVETKGTDDNGNPVDFKQPSVVIKIGSSNEAGIVIGSHFDTYKKYDPATSKEMCKDIQDSKMKKLCEDALSGDKPGADDDGSGSSVALEVARVLINSGMQFKKPIYLIWYAAEEIGMIGSQNVVEDFQKNNIPIEAVMQLDQVGYSYQNDPTIWFASNYVDASLTTYLAELTREYVKQPIKYTSCQGPCSDHVSWNAQGIPVAFPFESEMALGRGNLYVHSPWDTLDKLSLSHMTDYAKLAIAFAVELAEPVSGE